MNTYLIIGVLVLIGIITLGSFYGKRKIWTRDKEFFNYGETHNENRQEQRILKLTVTIGFGGDEKTISENANSVVIVETMQSTNWNKFHIVQLEDLSSKGFKALHVSGSFDDGLASGLVTDDDHVLLVKKIKTVDQMTEILLDFLKGEEIWRDKYKYK
ncbi:hypothetical protein [Cyclobacterium sp.]|uniref:hypothetical protein n=1 Tax=Cyclobacterium sp. TaxID=1966343 RepID=UPI0019BBB923|nr:hypothetical protein [Cyclobacterium sp.]MBD3629667.1 hypothetical protein [Cyclobacterium sp.]